MDKKNNEHMLSVSLIGQPENTEVNVYCGFHRDTVVECNAKVVQDIALAVPCIECGGTGVWDYFPEEISANKCVCCKGTGIQYVGI